VALRIQPVRDLVNNVRNDGPELVEPIDPAHLGEDSAVPALAGRPVGLFD
jgi:hypothetical protein